MRCLITFILILVTSTLASAAARDISQSQLDIQAHDMVYSSQHSANINQDDTCAPGAINAINVGTCSYTYYSWLPAKNYKITKVKIVVTEIAGAVGAGQCELSFWTDDFTDAFATQVGVDYAFDAQTTATVGTATEFDVNLDFTEGVPVGLMFTASAGTCQSPTGNDPDVQIFLYGRATN